MLENYLKYHLIKSQLLSWLSEDRGDSQCSFNWNINLFKKLNCNFSLFVYYSRTNFNYALVVFHVNCGSIRAWERFIISNHHLSLFTDGIYKWTMEWVLYLHFLYLEKFSFIYFEIENWCVVQHQKISRSTKYTEIQ